MSTEHPTKGGVVMTGLKQGPDLLLDDRRSFLQLVAALPDGPVVIRIEPEREARGLELNRRYWGVLRDIATARNENEADARHTTDSLHIEYKARFNGGASTAALPAERFRDYIDRVQAHAAQEHGVSFAPRESLLGGPRS